MPEGSPRLFCAGVAVGWVLLRFSLTDVRSGTAVRVVPAHALAPHTLEEPAPGSNKLPPPPPPSPPPPAGLHAECVGRTAAAPTVPDDIVLAIMTTGKRHGLIEMLRESWLSDAKALLLTDEPGLAERPKQRVRVWRGHHISL